MLDPRPLQPEATGLRVAIEGGLDAAEWADLAGRVRPALRFLTAGWWQAWADALLPYDSLARARFAIWWRAITWAWCRRFSLSPSR